MALQTKIRKPDGTTTITLKDQRVEMSISRDYTEMAIGAGKVVSVDVNKLKRRFVITGHITEEGATTAKTQVEQLEDAAVNWNANGSGKSTFFWGKKNDGTDKDYVVRIRELRISNSPRDVGGSGNIYDFQLTLTEIDTLSTSG